MNKKTLNIIFWIIIFGVLVACFYLIVLLRSEGGQCLANGLLYASEKQIEGDVICSCQVDNKGSISSLFFNNTAMSNKPLGNQFNIIPVQKNL